MEVAIPEDISKYPTEVQAGIEALRAARALKRAEREEDAKDHFSTAICAAGEYLSEAVKDGVIEYDARGNPRTIDGRKYIFDNSVNLKNLISSQQLLTTGKDGSENALNIAILNRTKDTPMRAEDVSEAEVMREIT